MCYLGHSYSLNIVPVFMWLAPFLAKVETLFYVAVE